MKKVAVVAVLIFFLLPVVGEGALWRPKVDPLDGSALASYERRRPEVDGTAATGKIAPNVVQLMVDTDADEMLSVIVTLRDEVDFGPIEGTRIERLQALVPLLQMQTGIWQQATVNFLVKRQAQGRVASFTQFWVFNGLAVTATADVIQELAAHADVLRITADAAAVSLPNKPDQMAQVDVASLQAVVGHGADVLVSSIGPAQVNDAMAQVAPQAVRLSGPEIPKRDLQTATAVHQSLQWVLDPDSNPETADAPQVLLLNWDLGEFACEPAFVSETAVLNAVDVLPIAVTKSLDCQANSAIFLALPAEIAPAAAGTLALLLSAQPDLSAMEQAQVLQTAVTANASTFDARAVINWLTR